MFFFPHEGSFTSAEEFAAVSNFCVDAVALVHVLPFVTKERFETFTSNYSRS